MSGRFSATLGWLAVVLFLIVFAMGASKPLLLDNMDFPAVAQATAQTGIPVYYRGEQHPHHVGLYHPPLYIYLLAAWLKALGAGAAQARLFGAVCALGQGACVLLLLRELFGKLYAQNIAPWFWGLFLLNAYTIQTAGITDIDSTIYGPLILLFLWTVVRLSWRNGEWRDDRISRLEWLLPIVALTACLWAKLTTIWLALPFLFLLMIRRFGWFRAARLAIMLSVAGIGAFLASYWVYGRVTNLPVGYTFAFTWESFRTRGASAATGLEGWVHDRWTNFRQMVPFMVTWTGLAPWLACLAVAVSGLWRGLRSKEPRLLHAAFILLLAMASIGYYCAQQMTYGASPFKYAFVYWGVVVGGALMAAFPPGKESTFPPARHAAWLLALWTGSAALSLCFVGDRTLTGMYGQDALKWPWIVPAAAVCAGLLLQVRARTAGRGLLAAGLALSGGVHLGMAVAQTAQDYATTYDYGERGFTDVVGYVRTHTAEGELIVSMKDVGYAAQRKYFESYAALYGDSGDMGRMRDLLSSGRASLAIFTEAHGQDQLAMNPPLRDWVLQNCRVAAAFGDYRIYRCGERLKPGESR